MSWFLLIALSAMPTSADESCWFVLRGARVGQVNVTLAEGKYSYVSDHLFAPREQVKRRRRTVSFKVDAEGRVERLGAPEALWLIREPKLGCVEGFEELTQRRGKLCADRVKDQQATLTRRLDGRIFSQPFTATYQNGRLALLTIGSARFSRVEPGDQLGKPRDVLSKTFTIEGSGATLELAPAATFQSKLQPDRIVDEKKVRAAVNQVRVKLLSERDVLCTDFVRELKKTNLPLVVVHGLVTRPMDSEGFPHVWVRFRLAADRFLDIDPTNGTDAKPSTHLALWTSAKLDDRESGENWLKLLNEPHRLLRR
jgi:hypothetical protein